MSVSASRKYKNVVSIVWEFKQIFFKAVQRALCLWEHLLDSFDRSYTVVLSFLENMFGKIVINNSSR